MLVNRRGEQSLVRLVGIIALFAWLLLVEFSQALAELPRWSEEELELLEKGLIIPGQALLTKEGIPRELLDDPSDTTEPEETDAPKELNDQPTEVVPAPELPDPEPLSDDRVNMTEEMLARYFEQLPRELLIDAQKILTQQEWRDVHYALEKHREVSPLPIYFYVFGHDQKIPENYWPKNVFEEHFSTVGEPRVIVYYHFGAPERTRLHMGNGFLDTVELWKKKEILANSRMKARDKSAGLSQLLDFVDQLSMRLYWIEEELELKTRRERAEQEELEVQRKQAEPTLMDHIEKWLPFMEGVFPKIGLGGAVIVLLGISRIVWVRKRRFVFPEIETEPRLGGQNGAGFGGVLSFKDPLKPPSAQREQFEDLL